MGEFAEFVERELVEFEGFVVRDAFAGEDFVGHGCFEDGGAHWPTIRRSAPWRPVESVLASGIGISEPRFATLAPKRIGR